MVGREGGSEGGEGGLMKGTNEEGMDEVWTAGGMKRAEEELSEEGR